MTITSMSTADLPKTAMVVMAYTSHLDVGLAEPLTFVVVGEHDGIASPAAMQRRVDALKMRHNANRIKPSVRTVIIRCCW